MTNPHTHRGRVYRRCACRHAGKQLGAHCPELTSNARHGTWTFAVDMPSLTGKRTTMRRGGYPTRKAATAALTRVLECERSGIWLDDRQTVADYLTTWLAEKSRTLKPTTAAVYTDYINKDLIPAFGAIRLEKLNHLHVARFIDEQLTAGRGPTTIRRLIATLSSALGDAVRQRRLQHNPARYAPLPGPTKPNFPCWTPTEAVTFLRHCAVVDDPLTDLFEVLIGTGLRKGEALALHWADLDEAVLFVRYALSNIRNTTPVMTTPKTKSSHAWVGLSNRVVSAFKQQARRQAALGVTSDLVFSQPNGAPLRPESVLHHFHRLCAAAGVPRIRVHDLRHLAAHTDDQLTGAAGDGIEDLAPLEAVDHCRHLRSPRALRRSASRRRDRRSPRRRGALQVIRLSHAKVADVRSQCDHNRAGYASSTHKAAAGHQQPDRL